MWLPPNHALSTTLPAVIALGEHCGLSGIEMITALIRGIEAQGRLRVASGQYEPRALTFHPPGIVGAIGSAVASAYLLGLEADRVRHAVEHCSVASGEFDGQYRHDDQVRALWRSRSGGSGRGAAGGTRLHCQSRHYRSGTWIRRSIFQSQLQPTLP